MRIIAGKYKNKEVLTPKGKATRPLLSRIRKSLFDILQPHLVEARFLDLFAGSGIVAIEALSRGASYALSIEADERTLEITKKNQKRVCPREPYRIVQADVIKYLPRLAMEENPFHVIGITPPYGKNYYNRTLESLGQYQEVLTEETVIFAQRDIFEDISLDWPYLDHIRTKRYGKTMIDFFLPKED